MNIELIEEEEFRNTDSGKFIVIGDYFHPNEKYREEGIADLSCENLLLENVIGP